MKKLKNFLLRHKKEIAVGTLILAGGISLISTRDKLKKKEGELLNLKNTCLGQEKAIKNLAYQLGKASSK